MPKDKHGEELAGIQQMPYRMQVGDHLTMKKMLIDDHLTFQSFTDCCIQAYLRSDRRMRALILDWKDADVKSVRIRAQKDLTITERDKLLDELEEVSPVEQGDA